ncbi:hypothetical protein [Spirosoma areae]
METFFMLMVLVFLPFGWFMLRMLRFTNETVGEDSPVYRERTYQFSASQYFGQFTKLLLAFLIIGMPILVYVMIKVAIQQDQFIGLLFAFFFSVFVLFLTFFFYVDWLYWIITRNISITFNPFQSSLTIHSLKGSICLTTDNLSRIEEHLTKSSNSKYVFDRYGYILFYTTDGQIVQINNIFFSHIGHVEFIERFFQKIPKTIVWHRLLAWPIRIESAKTHP